MLGPPVTGVDEQGVRLGCALPVPTGRHITARQVQPGPPRHRLEGQAGAHLLLPDGSHGCTRRDADACAGLRAALFVDKRDRADRDDRSRGRSQPRSDERTTALGPPNLVDQRREKRLGYRLQQ